MLPAGILGVMMLGDLDEGFSADPPIQRWIDSGGHQASEGSQADRSLEAC